MPAVQPQTVKPRHPADIRNTLRRARAQTGPMPHHFGLRQRRQQLDCRSLEALQRDLGRGLVEAFVLQRAADQNVPVATRNRITSLGQHHARQEIRCTLVENHLALDRLDRERQIQCLEQITAPCPGRQHDLLAADQALGRLDATHSLAFANKPADFALLVNRHVRQRQQRRFQRLHQPWVSDVGHIGHVDRPGEPATQHRHRVVHRRDIHSPQRTVFPLSPGQCFGFIFKIQPVQAGGVHFGINSGIGKQPLAQLWIKILRPMRQRSDGRAVAPRVQRGNDAATGPGRFLADVRAIQQHHAAHFGGEVVGGQQANHPATDNHHLLLPGHV